MGTQQNFFVGPFLRLIIEVTEKDVEVARVCTSCPDDVVDLGAGGGPRHRRDVWDVGVNFCPKCGAPTEPRMEGEETWDNPDDEEFRQELVMPDSVSDPETEKFDGRKVKCPIYISNLSGTPGGRIDFDEVRLVGPRIIDLSVRTFLKVHKEKLDELRVRYGKENVEVLYGAFMCYR